MARFQTSVQKLQEERQRVIQLSPSEVVQMYFRLPIRGKLRPFGLEGRRYLLPIYDGNARRMLLMQGRQTEKSSTVGNKLLLYSACIPHFKSLYISPTQIQTSQFSNDRIKLPIYYSEFLGAMHDSSSLVNRINHKEFFNRSELRLRYAFLNADRVRGIQSDLLVVDEIQDILTDLLPVIEETLFHSEEYKWRIYAGTPKSEDNTLARYWHQNSTQNEWVIPCDRHYPQYWNIAGEGNIPTRPTDGLVCEKCHKSIDPRHQDAHWAARNPDAGLKLQLLDPDADNLAFEGFRVPQLITPMVDWVEMLDKQQRYSRQRFFNEVLALPYDSGLRPLTREDIQRNCDPRVTMEFSSDFQQDRAYFKSLSATTHTYLGIDWGTGEGSYTYAVIGGYTGDKLTVFYTHRFEGQETEPDRQLAVIQNIVSDFNINLIGTDYGGGFDRNDKLVRWYGPQRVFKFHYDNIQRKIEWDSKLGRFHVRRTEVMSDLFAAIKRGGVFRLPRWEEVENDLAKEMLAIFSEYYEATDALKYDHSPGDPDDGFHALLYMFLASCIQHPRPDVLFAGTEAATQPDQGGW